MTLSSTLRRRYCNIGGTKVAYVEYGEGPAVVLIHGIGHSLFAWRKNLLPIAQAGYRTLAFDIPGFGFSDFRNFPDIASFDIFFQELIDYFGYSKYSIVGNSLGGHLGFHISARHPDRVESLIMLSPAGATSDVYFPFRFMSTRLGQYFEPKVTRKLVENALRTVFADPSNIEEEIDHIMLYATDDRFKRAFNSMLRAGLNLKGIKPEFRMDLWYHKIQCPVMVIWGDSDRVLSVEGAQIIKEHIPQTEVVILEKVGHCPQIEAYATVNKLIIDFLTKNIRN